MEVIRGWMIDAARLPEPLDVYRRTIDTCAMYGLNTILLRLTDDQGSAIQFGSHPELSTHTHAYTPQEMSDLALYAAQRGVDIIPEIEAFGHTGFITRCAEFNHLLDQDPKAHAHFTGIIPQHPDALALMADLFQETAKIFPSPYLHAGCDEVNWGKSAYSQRMISASGRAEVWAGYINALEDLTRQNDKQLMIWADHPLQIDPGILTKLNRSIILVDWNYWDTDPAAVMTRAQHAIDQGFNLVGAPAWIWCRWSVRPGESQLENINAFRTVYNQLPEPGSLGLIVTNWVPSRYLSSAVNDGIAYAAANLAPNSPSDQHQTLTAYYNDHFQAQWSPEWDELLSLLFKAVPPRRACARGLSSPYQTESWSDPEDLLRMASQQPMDPSQLVRLSAQIQRCADSVQRNSRDYQGLALSINYLLHLQRRHQLVFQAARSGNSAEIHQVIARIADLDEQLASGLTAEWDLTRFQDDPAKTELLPDLRPSDQTVYAMQKAAQFSRSLVSQPTKIAGLFESGLE